jgi:mono/diheme cytochrome c family protein
VFSVFAQTTVTGNSSSSGLYTEGQASRGKIEYRKSCSGCHLENLSGGGTVPALSGDEFISHYFSVGDLYSKVSMSMPADNVHGLSPDTYSNIVAYLLQSNGLRPGKDAIPRDVSLMKKMVLRRKKPMPALSNVEVSGTDRLDRYFTEEQAERGKAYFQGSCSLCHSTGTTPDQLTPGPGRGALMGGEKRFFRIGGDQFAARWRNAANLFDKIHTTMPAYDAGGLSTQEYVDIVAYFMQVSGFPAGKEELKADRNLMKNVNLDKGFKSLFNGTDFTGLRFIIGNNCTPRPDGCGQTEPGTTFRVEDGTIYCSGKPHGYMYTEKKYMNFTLRLDYRYKPYSDTESDEFFYGNSGYLLFITKNQVWPKMIEIQGQNSNVLSAFGVDARVTATDDPEARKRAIKPVGQWNSIEIVSKDGQVKSYLNGTLISTVSEHEFKEPGYIGFQSEGAEISWRDIRIREE